MKAILLLLILMLFHACGVLMERVRRFKVASGQIHPLTGTPEANLATLTARSVPGAILTRVAFVGLETFQFTHPYFSPAEAVEFAHAAMWRCRKRVHAEIKSGLSSVVTIAALAPFVGLTGTVFGLLLSFRGGSNTPTGWLVFYGNAIALSLLPTALGLLVGIVAV